MQRESRRNIRHLVYLRLGRLRHPAPRIGREGLQITPGTLCIDDAKCERRFAGTGDARHPHYLVERNIHVHPFQVMNPRTPYLYPVNHNNRMQKGNRFHKITHYSTLSSLRHENASLPSALPQTKRGEHTGRCYPRQRYGKRAGLLSPQPLSGQHRRGRPDTDGTPSGRQIRRSKCSAVSVSNFGPAALTTTGTDIRSPGIR